MRDKILGNHTSDKGLIYYSKYMNNSYNSTAKKKKKDNNLHDLIKKPAEDVNTHFSREDMQMAVGI